VSKPPHDDTTPAVVLGGARLDGFGDDGA
jgi:hypothetical protein